MKKVLAIVFLFGAVSAFAQGIRYGNTIFTTGGFPNATIYVCTEPATDGPTGVGCTPPASVFSDPGLTVPISQPFQSDANGNFSFFANPASTYHINISGLGLTPYDIPYVSLGGGSGGSSDLPGVAGNSACYISGAQVGPCAGLNWLGAQAYFAANVRINLGLAVGAISLVACGNPPATSCNAYLIGSTVGLPTVGEVEEWPSASCWVTGYNGNAEACEARGYPVQGQADPAVLGAGTISGIGAALCTDANGGATTVGCPSGIPYPGAGVAVSTGSAWGTSLGLQGTDANAMTAGTVGSGTGLGLCTDANHGATTAGCSSGSTITVNGGSTLGSPVNLQNGTNTTVTNPSGNNVQVNVSAGAGFPSAQIGDTYRYNVNGDSAVDAVNYAAKMTLVAYDFGSGSLTLSGASTTAPTTLGSTSNVNPTLTDGGAITYTSASSASTSTVIGVDQGTGGSYGSYGIGSFYRWTLRFAAGQTTNVRYWLGMTVYFSGGTGTNGSAPLNTTALATNTLNKSTLAFRFTAGTDTYWQACAATAGGSQTCTSTGVAPDTSPHFFEIITNGTTVTFLIDHANATTVSTNVPSGTLGGNSMAEMFWTGDNLNTANAVAGTFYWMSISLK